MNKPESSVDDLHAQIMNLPDGVIPAPVDSDFIAGFRRGHKSARHAAADLVAAHPSNQVLQEPVATHHVWMIEQEIGSAPAYLRHLGWMERTDRKSHTYPIWSHSWQHGAMFHTRESAECVVEAINLFPVFDEENAHFGWRVVAHDIEVAVDRAASPQAVPSEQPIAEQSQSDKANLMVAVGSDLPPALLQSDALTMALSLYGESDDTFAPETREVMVRWRPVVEKLLRGEA